MTNIAKTAEEEALNYLSQGFSVIPVGIDKKPLINWRAYQAKQPSEQEVKDWFKQRPDAGVAIITGSISKLAVVDVDQKTGGLESVKALDLPPTVTAKTGGGGFHYYFIVESGVVIKNSTSFIAPGIDIRGEGGYVVAPPSRHLSGGEYVWVKSFADIEPAPFPSKLLEMQKAGLKTAGPQQLTSEINAVGMRNTQAARVCGKLLRSLDESEWEKIGWISLQQWNKQKNNPPLDQPELRAVFDSIAGRERSSRLFDGAEQNNPKKVKISKAIVSEVKPKLHLFKDDLGEAYASIQVNGHKEIWPISSRNKNFRLWLTRECQTLLGQLASNNALDEAANSLEADAIYEGELIPLYNRVAPGEDGSLWFDMADNAWRAIHITKEGWKMVDNPPVLFRRYQHQLPQVTPDPAGDIRLIDEFLNLSNKEYRVLIYAYLVSAFVPEITIPCLILHGPQGSSKTTLFKMLRSLLDPSRLEVLDFHESKKEIVQMLDHNRVAYFDNLWRIKKDISDLLCKVITGSGFSQRKLYSDDADLMRAMKRVVGLNGILLSSSQADLLERSIVIEMETIDTENRKSEKRLWSQFEALKPKILGGILNLVSEALNKLPQISETDLPRMADFALWGEAVMAVLKEKDASFGSFKVVYRRNMFETTEKGIEADKVASAVVIWLKNGGLKKWEGTASDLLGILSDIAVLNKIIPDYKAKFWPDEANKLSERLNLAKPLLKAKGISIAQERTSDTRKIIITVDQSLFVVTAPLVTAPIQVAPTQASLLTRVEPKKVELVPPPDEYEEEPEDFEGFEQENEEDSYFI